MANFLRSFSDRRVFRVLPGQNLSGQVLGEEMRPGWAGRGCAGAVPAGSPQTLTRECVGGHTKALLAGSSHLAGSPTYKQSLLGQPGLPAQPGSLSELGLGAVTSAPNQHLSSSFPRPRGSLPGCPLFSNLHQWPGREPA